MRSHSVISGFAQREPGTPAHNPAKHIPRSPPDHVALDPGAPSGMTRTHLRHARSSSRLPTDASRRPSTSPSRFPIRIGATGRLRPIGGGPHAGQGRALCLSFIGDVRRESVGQGGGTLVRSARPIRRTAHDVAERRRRSRPKSASGRLATPTKSASADAGFSDVALRPHLTAAAAGWIVPAGSGEGRSLLTSSRSGEAESGTGVLERVSSTHPGSGSPLSLRPG